MHFQQVAILTSRPDPNVFPAFQGSTGNDLAIVAASVWSLAMGDGNDAVISLSHGTFADMGRGNDVALGGNAGGNAFIGGEGNDYLAVAGGDGNYLDGGPGADMIFGGTGRDTISFDANDLLVFGGAGADTFRLNPFYSGGVARIADFDGTSSQHDVLDLSMFGGLARENISLFGYGLGEQLLYVEGNAGEGRPAVAIVGVHFDGIDQAVASGALVLGYDGARG